MDLEEADGWLFPVSTSPQVYRETEAGNGGW